MPELPEVETVRRRLAACLPGLVVDDVVVNDPLVSLQDEDELRSAVRGRRVTAVRRRGKYLIVDLDDVLLVVHLRMTGRLLLAPEPGARPPRLVVRLRPASELLFYDTRRFGRVWTLPAAHEDTFFAALGPEPFGTAFTTSYLRGALRSRTTPLKSFLLDQRRIAGVGNIYADEALFRAHLNPLRTAGTLGPGEVARLRDALLDTLRLGIEQAGASIDTFVDPDGASGAFQDILNVYGRTGLPCRDLRRHDRARRARRARHAFLPFLPVTAARRPPGRRRARGPGPRARRAARPARREGAAAGRAAAASRSTVIVQPIVAAWSSAVIVQPIVAASPAVAPASDGAASTSWRPGCPAARPSSSASLGAVAFRAGLVCLRGQRATRARRPRRAPPPRRQAAALARRLPLQPIPGRPRLADRHAPVRVRARREPGRRGGAALRLVGLRLPRPSGAAAAPRVPARRSRRRGRRRAHPAKRRQ